jgi:hypothetical protein
VPLFATVHRAPGFSREEIQQNASEALAGKFATMRHLYINVFEGFILSLYEGDSAEAVEKEFEHLGFPFDEIHEIQVDMNRDQLQAMLDSPPEGGR